MYDAIAKIGSAILGGIVIFVIIILVSCSDSNDSRKDNSRSSSYKPYYEEDYDFQQFRDDYNYFKGRYDAMTGQ